MAPVADSAARLPALTRGGHPGGRAPRRAARWLPTGLLAGCAGGALLLAAALPLTSAALWSVLLGAAAGPVARRAGDVAAASRVASIGLRLGVALLGVRVSLGQVAELGAPGLALAVGTAAATLGATLVLGRWLGLDRRLTLLLGTGSAICGASAIAAMEQVARAGREQVSYATGIVTVTGTVAMFATPVVGVQVLGLSPETAGLWAGASIHEVAQVAGAGALISTTALAVATIVKLARVATLAPAVAIATLIERRRGAGAPGARVPLLPWFLVAFVALAASRSAGAVPAGALGPAATAANALLALGLAGCGMAMRASRLRAAGARPALLGLAAWLTAAAISLGLTVVLF